MNDQLIMIILPFMMILFVIILAIHKNGGIILKTIIQDVSLQTNKECNIMNCNSSNNKSYFTETCHTLQRKRQRTVIDYSNKLLDNYW